MLRNKGTKWTILAMVAAVLLIAVPALAGEAVTVTGVVNGFSLTAQDGQAYDIGDTPKGDEMAALGPKSVTVTGTLQEDEWGKILDVESYTVLGDAPEAPAEEAAPAEEPAGEGEPAAEPATGSEG